MDESVKQHLKTAFDDYFHQQNPQVIPNYEVRDLRLRVNDEVQRHHIPITKNFVKETLEEFLKMMGYQHQCTKKEFPQQYGWVLVK